MSKNKVIKSVSFNITNEKDQEYLKRIEDVNFSGYVKELIEKDIKRMKGQRSEKGGIKIIVGGGITD
jgi:hypothetical protein